MTPEQVQKQEMETGAFPTESETPAKMSTGIVFPSERRNLPSGLEDISDAPLREGPGGVKVLDFGEDYEKSVQGTGNRPLNLKAMGISDIPM